MKLFLEKDGETNLGVFSFSGSIEDSLYDGFEWSRTEDGKVDMSVGCLRELLLARLGHDDIYPSFGYDEEDYPTKRIWFETGGGIRYGIEERREGCTYFVEKSTEEGQPSAFVTAAIDAGFKVDEVDEDGVEIWRRASPLEIFLPPEVRNELKGLIAREELVTDDDEVQFGYYLTELYYDEKYVYVVRRIKDMSNWDPGVLLVPEILYKEVITENTEANLIKFAEGLPEKEDDD